VSLVNRLLVLVLAAFTASAQNTHESAATSAAHGFYWPSGKWRIAQPESQGIDSQVLASVLDKVSEQHLGVHSLLVIRHGYAPVDASFYPYDGSVPHDLASVTKTLTSVLAGIAVSRQLVTLDQLLLSFFPREAPPDPGEPKGRITVKDLLKMESGLDCGYAPGERELEQMKRSPDWVRFALALPMKYDPGTHSAYCSPGYHLLGSVIGAASHMTELEFGRKYLFNPLGIHEVIWAEDPQGRSHGWGDSHLFPQDLAKIGYLYLHGGDWNGNRILPESWVTMSVTPPAGQRGGPGGLGYEWGATNGPNGRQFGGNGRGGQSFIIWPDLDTIVVITAGGNAGQIARLVRDAIKSSHPLPANQDAYARLQQKVTDAAKAPSPVARSPIPPLAASISGVVYDFSVNPSRLDSLSLTFPKSGDARVDITYYGRPYSFPMGLDGVYRVAPDGPFHLPAGAQGRWTNDTTFLLDLNFIANINHYTLEIHFESGSIDVTADEASGVIRNGKLTGKRKS
jgi:CubicO group peptidase (beta-lactamase class C family)